MTLLDLRQRALIRARADEDGLDCIDCGDPLTDEQVDDWLAELDADPEPGAPSCGCCGSCQGRGVLLTDNRDDCAACAGTGRA